MVSLPMDHITMAARLRSRRMLSRIWFAPLRAFRVVPVNQRHNRNFAPDQQTKRIGHAQRMFIVRVVRQADKIAVQLLDQPQLCACIGGIISHAGLEITLIMHGNAAQKNGFAIKQDLLAMACDGAEPDLIAQACCPALMMT